MDNKLPTYICDISKRLLQIFRLRLLCKESLNAFEDFQQRIPILYTGQNPKIGVKVPPEAKTTAVRT